MRKIYFLVSGVLLATAYATGQVTIAQQDFEVSPASPEWTISAGSGNISTNTGSTQTPANQSIRNGARSWQVNNSGATTPVTLELASVSLTGYTSVSATIYLSSTSATTGNGADGGDYIRVFTALNGGAFAANSATACDIQVVGNSNSRWGYNTTGATTNSGTNLQVVGSPGTNQGTIYSKLVINIPDGSSSVALRVLAANNDGNEFWNIDDIVLTGTSGSCSGAPTVQAGFASVSPGPDAATVTLTAGTGGVGRVLKINTSNSFTDMADGANPAANTVYGGGEQVVFNGTGLGPVNITGLTATTSYYLAVYEYNCGTGRFYLNPGATTSFATTAAPVIVAPGEILINQFSPDYDAASDEYVQLVNTTNKTFDLSTLAIRYQSSAGNAGSAGGTLSGTLQPFRYWVLSPNTTITVGQTFALQVDGSITAGFASAAGQLALVRISDNTIIDALGYGTLSGGDYFETAAAPAPPANGGLRRNPNATDTDNNSVDFVTVTNNLILLQSSQNSPLPVFFAHIKAFPLGSGIRIEWSNLSETDVDHYTIERSADGRHFSDLVQVNATRNDGGRADYSGLDASPLNGVNFYRIRSLELDGKSVYSIIARADTRGGDTHITLYPNPVNGNSPLSLQANELEKGAYMIRVFNAAGQQLYQRGFIHPGGFITQSLDLPAGMGSGSYYLWLQGHNISLTQPFIIR